VSLTFTSPEDLLFPDSSQMFEVESVETEVDLIAVVARIEPDLISPIL
jgi:hypothetical protein